jgi:hypothetical protein
MTSKNVTNDKYIGPGSAELQFAVTLPKAKYQVPRTRLKLIKRVVCFNIPESRVPSTKDQAKVDEDKSLL